MLTRQSSMPVLVRFGKPYGRARPWFIVDRFLDLSKRDEVVQRVLRDWLLRELRDELVSRLTWQDQRLAEWVPGLRVRVGEGQPVEVYYLTPVGIGGKFFYEHPVGEALYSAEAQVVVEHEGGAMRVGLGEGRLFWVGSGDPKGYRISEGFEDLYESILASLKGLATPASVGTAPRTRSGFRSQGAGPPGSSRA